MADLKQRVRGIFPDAHFGAPVDAARIAKAAADLDWVFPPDLAALYGAFDGVLAGQGPSVLYPLEDVCIMNAMLRARANFPAFARTIVFFGDYGMGPLFGYQQDRVVSWSPDLGADPATVKDRGYDIWDAWRWYRESEFY